MMVVAMSLVLVGWAVWGGAFVGVGLLGLRLLGRRVPDDAPAPWLAFWVGFSIVCAALQLWHFAFRVDDVARGTVLLAGVVGLATDRAVLAAWWRDRRATAPRIALVVWLANRAIAPGETADSGMYHYVAVDWITSFPVVVGLANLSGWQALNNANFLYDALLDAGPFRGRVEHLANGLLVAVWATQWCGAAVATWRRAARSSDVYALAVLPLLVLFALGTEMPSLDNDLPGGMLALATGAAAIALAERGRDGASTWRAAAVVLLASVAACCKLSMIALAGGWVVAVLYWMPAARRGRLMAWTLAIVAVTGGPWLVRNALLTGYPLYPSAVAPLPVEWRVPIERVAMHHDGIAESAHYLIPSWLSRVATRQGLGPYARLMTPTATSVETVTATNWIRPWLFTIPLWGPVEIVVPLALAGVVAGLALRTKREPSASSIPLPIAIVPIVGMGFWFLLAPDPRFGWAASWTTLAVVASIASPTLVARKGHRCVVAICAVCVVPLGFKIVAEKVMWNHAVLPRIPFVMPGSDGGFHPRPHVDYVDWTSRQGVLIHQPADGGSLVWSGPLPRLGWPKPDADLAYRVPGSLAGGFVIRRATQTTMRP